MTITTIEQLKEYQAQGDKEGRFTIEFQGFKYVYTSKPSEALKELKEMNGGKI